MKIFRALVFLQFILTLALITLGGVVHNTGSSLACPDWPLCFGMIMPPMEGQVAIEHSHRLLGATVGLVSIFLVILAFKNKSSRSLKILTSTGLGLVIFQGVLGGVTVLMKLSPVVSTAHLVTSQIFLANLVLLLFASSKSQPIGITDWKGQDFFRFVPWTLGLCLFQMGLGAFIRHGGAALACGLGPESMFLCRSHEDFSLVFWPNLGPAQANMLHRYVGLLLLVAVIWTTLPVLRKAKELSQVGLKNLCVSCHAIVFLQVVLGLWTLASGIHPLVVTLHLVGGVSLWVVLWAIWGVSLQISFSSISPNPHERVRTSQVGGQKVATQGNF